MIKKYSLKESGRSLKLSEHFVLGEFACHDGSDEVLVSEELVFLLEEIRAWARIHIAPEAVVIVSSGYRTRSYNSTIPGSAKDSQHCKGTAADIKIKSKDGFAPVKFIYEALDDGDVSEWVGGLGLYSSWVHVDVRGNRARWNGKV